MKATTRFLVGLLACFAAGCDTPVKPVKSLAEGGKLVVVTTNGPATWYEDSQGRATGFEFDLVTLFAKEIGLDMAQWKKDLEDPKLKEEVLADQKLGTSLGASGTPTFFINGRQLVGAQPFDKFKEMIDGEIKAADELIKAGTALGDVYKQRAK